MVHKKPTTMMVMTTMMMTTIDIIIGKKNDIPIQETITITKKRKYSTRDDAERVIRRMQENGCVGGYRLCTYYNEEYEGWFVGKSKYD